MCTSIDRWHVLTLTIRNFVCAISLSVGWHFFLYFHPLYAFIMWFFFFLRLDFYSSAGAAAAENHRIFFCFMWSHLCRTIDNAMTLAPICMLVIYLFLCVRELYTECEFWITNTNNNNKTYWFLSLFVQQTVCTEHISNLFGIKNFRSKEKNELKCQRQLAKIDELKKKKRQLNASIKMLCYDLAWASYENGILVDGGKTKEPKQIPH